jgi:hypothetical protein
MHQPMFLLMSSCQDIAENTAKVGAKNKSINESKNTDLLLAQTAKEQTHSIDGNIHAFNYYLK